jgi:Glycosyltransferase WbsX
MSAQQYFFSYFPQFHPDPINDKAWGEGFTDWDLIRSLPDGVREDFTPERGYYNPTEPEYLNSLCAQLNKLPFENAGLMVYHYHFDGVSALSGFEQQLLAQPQSTPPFFLCWANETWSKRWVGQSREILIEQKHSLDAALIRAHARYLIRFFELPHYHRVDGRPVFMIYNAQASVNLPRALKIYREEFALMGHEPLLGVCIGYPQPPDQLAPYDFGCEFEPRFFFNSFSSSLIAQNAARLKTRFPKVFEWLGAQRDRFRRGGKGQQFEFQDYLDALKTGRIEKALRMSTGLKPLMRSTFLSWDNSPRYRKMSTKVGHRNVSPESLEALGRITSDKDLPVLINSWNEWSEGAALEAGVRPSRLHPDFLKALASR